MDNVNLFEHNAMMEAKARMMTLPIAADQQFPAPLRKLTPQQEVEQTLHTARLLQGKIADLRDQFPDNRGNLEESERFISDMVLNLEGHLRDIKEGKESFVSHEPDCGCDDCAAARSDEHYDRKRDGMTA